MELSLPKDLDSMALVRFDSLVAKGEILYGPSQPERTEHDGFEFEFRIASALTTKPILSPDAPGRFQPIGPFVNPDPDFTLTAVGPSHILELSKYCIYRPSFILHTKDYVPQVHDLDVSDISAAWATLKALKSPQIVLYNCGVEAGSSQGHKHLQIFPRPSLDDFKLPPDGRQLPLDKPTSLPDVPYKHWVIGIPRFATAVDVAHRYFQLLEKTKENLKEQSDCQAYNIVFVEEWIILIPRTHKGREDIGANGAGMMGLVWVRDQHERDGWTRFGMTKHLTYLGIPRGIRPNED
ncbi:hypothetical protein AOQ84DRAFT_297103 [Glonium stellatum]|uniref:Uncharacterized protein n=1 Tax=Glonium stellatum TaxID=574774 RepID=A0A8E2JR55_9PEZI|nr:hypothetical protein AOQ84DRAFT_297103 [Glonium stellatum]